MSDRPKKYLVGTIDPRGWRLELLLSGSVNIPITPIYETDSIVRARIRWTIVELGLLFRPWKWAEVRTCLATRSDAALTTTEE